jgi:hypothetical protein
MNTKLYYKSPKDRHFEELRSVCIRYWSTFDDTFGYATEKINQVKSFENNEGNFMTMVKMIHPLAWEVIAEVLSLETRNHVSIRLEAGGDSLEADFFNIWGTNEAKEKYGQLD